MYKNKEDIETSLIKDLYQEIDVELPFKDQQTPEQVEEIISNQLLSIKNVSEDLFNEAVKVIAESSLKDYFREVA